MTIEMVPVTVVDRYHGQMLQNTLADCSILSHDNKNVALK